MILHTTPSGRSCRASGMSGFGKSLSRRVSRPRSRQARDDESWLTIQPSSPVKHKKRTGSSPGMNCSSSTGSESLLPQNSVNRFLYKIAYDFYKNKKLHQTIISTSVLGRDGSSFLSPAPGQNRAPDHRLPRCRPKPGSGFWRFRRPAVVRRTSRHARSSPAGSPGIRHRQGWAR